MRLRGYRAFIGQSRRPSRRYTIDNGQRDARARTGSIWRSPHQQNRPASAGPAAAAGRTAPWRMKHDTSLQFVLGHGLLHPLFACRHFCSRSGQRLTGQQAAQAFDLGAAWLNMLHVQVLHMACNTGRCCTSSGSSINVPKMPCGSSANDAAGGRGTLSPCWADKAVYAPERMLLGGHAFKCLSKIARSWASQLAS